MLVVLSKDLNQVAKEYVRNEKEPDDDYDDYDYDYSEDDADDFNEPNEFPTPDPSDKWTTESYFKRLIDILESQTGEKVNVPQSWWNKLSEMQKQYKTNILEVGLYPFSSDVTFYCVDADKTDDYVIGYGVTREDAIEDYLNQ